MIVMLAACATSADQAPVTTYDGLQQVPSKQFATVYVKPGVDLGVYQSFGVTHCEVAFRKNWLRDQNASRLDLSNRVTQRDVERIKSRLSELCEQNFRRALAADPAYKVVEEFTNGEAVLVLRPAIVDLEINAPDVRSTSRTRSYTTSAGEMTLYLELVDATTSEVLARIVDRQRDFQDSRLSWSNSATNQAEANRILSRWARELREGLDAVHRGAVGLSSEPEAA